MRRCATCAASCEGRYCDACNKVLAMQEERHQFKPFGFSYDAPCALCHLQPEDEVHIRERRKTDRRQSQRRGKPPSNKEMLGADVVVLRYWDGHVGAFRVTNENGGQQWHGLGKVCFIDSYSGSPLPGTGEPSE